LRKKCIICGRPGGIFSNGLEEHQGGFFHSDCFNRNIVTPEQYRLEKGIEAFSKIKFNYESELEAMVEFDYLNPTKSIDRMFFGKGKSDKIYSKDFLKTSKNNFVYIRIIPSPKRNIASFEYGGNKSIGDNFEAGYTVLITLRDSQPKLRQSLISIMNKHNFGCLPASKTLHCHLDSPNPTEDEARKILEEIMTEFSEMKQTV